MPGSYSSSKHNPNHNQSTQSNAEILEFKVNTVYLNNGREICGYIDDEVGEFQSIQKPNESQQSNPFNKQKDKIGRKHNYLMIDGERIANDAEYDSKAKKTKILISIGPGDKKKAEQLLQMGAMLGYVDKKTKLFVPRNIDKRGAVFSRSRSSEKFKKKKSKKSRRERNPLAEIKKTNLNESSPDLSRMMRNRSKSSKDIPYQRKFVDSVEKITPDQRRDRTQEYVAKSKERIKKYKESFLPDLKYDYKPGADIDNLPLGDDLYSKIEKEN